MDLNQVKGSLPIYCNNVFLIDVQWSKVTTSKIYRWQSTLTGYCKNDECPVIVVNIREWMFNAVARNIPVYTFYLLSQL